MDYWEILGIDATTDKKVVKRAYAKKLKITRPDDDAVGYQALREAYDWAYKYGVHSDSENDLNDVNENIDVGFDEIRVLGQETSAVDADWPPSLEDDLVEGRPQVVSHYQLALDAVNELLSKEDEVEMIDLFSRWLVGGEISNLKVRDAFSDICFARAVEDFDMTNYPCKLFRHMASEFGWLTDLQTDYFRASNQEKLQVRFDAYSDYEVLREYHEESRWSDFLDSEFWLAKILLGPVRSTLFFIFSRSAIFNMIVRRKISKFELARTYQVIPEIETPAFMWWENYFSKPRFSITHIFIGNIFALAIGFEQDAVSSNLSFTIFYLLCMVVGVLLTWVLALFYHRALGARNHMGLPLYDSYFWYCSMLIAIGAVIFVKNELSTFIFGAGLTFSLWKLVGFFGICRVSLIFWITTFTAEKFEITNIADWELLLLALTVSSYFAFNQVLPKLPLWLIRASTSTGFPHIIIVSALTSILLVLAASILTLNN